MKSGPQCMGAGYDHLRVVPAEDQHAHQLEPLLREADRAEILRANWPRAIDSLLYGIRTSRSFVALADGSPVMVFGISESASVWALGTDYITEHPKEFMRMARRIFPWIFAGLPVVWCCLDIKNTVHAAWLSAMGFSPDPHSNPGDGFEVYYLLNNYV